MTNNSRGGEDSSTLLKETNMKIEAVYVGVGDAETLTGVSRWTWRRWAYDGKVESVKLGKRLLIPRAEISRLVNENTRPRIKK